MVVFPNCKINIGLYITEKRSDGYHNLETIFFPVPWCDALEMVPAKNATTTLTLHHNTLPGQADDNIVMKAYRLLQKKFPLLPAFEMHLLKAIPTGAGLGGGSADGAFALRLLNDLAELHLPEQELLALALQLGSDCPFFILNTPCLGYARGEVLERLPLSLTGWHIVLIHPGIHVATAWAFGKIKPHPADFDLRLLPNIPVKDWKQFLRNDFQQPVVNEYPLIGKIIDSLYAKGAAYAAMSGSGSTVYGLFSNAIKTADWEMPDNYRHYTTVLS